MNTLIKKSGSVRQSNMELLRIIAMVLIVFHHIGVHSGLGATESISVLNRFWVLLLQSGGKIGVNVFVMISGYFSITNTNWKIDKILKLLLQILSYSVPLYIVFASLGYIAWDIREMIKYFLPTVSISWWFVNAYFMLIIVSPVLNKMLTALDQKNYLRILFILLICWSVLPTVMSAYMHSNSFLWFVFLYSLSGYIRLYGREVRLSSAKLLSLAAAIVMLIITAMIVIERFGIATFLLEKLGGCLVDMQYLPVLTTSLLVFMGFLKMKINYNPVINKIASTTFGIYLLHDDDVIRELLWMNWFSPKKFEPSPWFIPYTLGIGIVVFIGCAVIDLIRQHTLEKAYTPLIAKTVSCIKNIKNRYLFWL